MCAGGSYRTTLLGSQSRDPTAKEHAGLYAVLSTGVLTDAEHVLQAMLSETYDIYGREIMASGKVGRELSAMAQTLSVTERTKGLAIDLQSPGRSNHGPGDPGCDPGRVWTFAMWQTSMLTGGTWARPTGS